MILTTTTYRSKEKSHFWDYLYFIHRIINHDGEGWLLFCSFVKYLLQNFDNSKDKIPRYFILKVSFLFTKFVLLDWKLTAIIHIVLFSSSRYFGLGAGLKQMRTVQIYQFLLVVAPYRQIVTLNHFFVYFMCCVLKCCCHKSTG